MIGAKTSAIDARIGVTPCTTAAGAIVSKTASIAAKTVVTGARMCATAARTGAIGAKTSAIDARTGAIGDRSADPGNRAGPSAPAGSRAQGWGGGVEGQRAPAVQVRRPAHAARAVTVATACSRLHPDRHSTVMRTRLQIAIAALLCAAGCAPAPARPPQPLNVVTYNIRHGRGMDDRVDVARIAAVLRALDADVVGLQEVDVGVERSGRIDEAAELGQRLGMQHAFGSFFDYQGGRYGLAILSRYPVRRTHVVRLPDGNEPRVALAVEIQPPGIPVLLVVDVHFDWVADDAFRFAQAAALTAFLDTLSVPWILLGDFNDVPDSRTLALFFQRAGHAAKPASDPWTFSSTDPRREIDYIFVAPPEDWRIEAVRVIDEPLASDHRPVRAVLRYRSRTSDP